MKAWFSPKMDWLYTLTKDGYLFQWKWVQDYVSQEYKYRRQMQKKNIGNFSERRPEDQA